MIAEGMMLALAQTADGLLPASGVVLPQALGCLMSALMTLTDRIAQHMLTIPKDSVDRVAAAAQVAETRGQLQHGLQILYQVVSTAGDTPSIIIPKITTH